MSTLCDAIRHRYLAALTVFLEVACRWFPHVSPLLRWSLTQSSGCCYQLTQPTREAPGQNGIQGRHNLEDYVRPGSAKPKVPQCHFPPIPGVPCRLLLRVLIIMIELCLLSHSCLRFLHLEIQVSSHEGVIMITLGRRR